MRNVFNFIFFCPTEYHHQHPESQMLNLCVFRDNCDGVVLHISVVPNRGKSAPTMPLLQKIWNNCSKWKKKLTKKTSTHSFKQNTFQ